jgi:hypothetical protein
MGRASESFPGDENHSGISTVGAWWDYSVRPNGLAACEALTAVLTLGIIGYYTWMVAQTLIG